MARFVYDEAEYESGSKWFARWHREQHGDDATAIDLDLMGYCRHCLDPLYLVEATRSNTRKTATVLEHLGGLLTVPVAVWVVYRDKTGARPNQILVDNRSTGQNFGWLAESDVWSMLRHIRSAHICAIRQAS